MASVPCPVSECRNLSSGNDSARWLSGSIYNRHQQGSFVVFVSVYMATANGGMRILKPSISQNANTKIQAGMRFVE